MTPFQTFMWYLHQLMTTPLGCENVLQSAAGPTHVVTYGGNCLQAFWNSVYTHGEQAMIWLDQTS